MPIGRCIGLAMLVHECRAPRGLEAAGVLLEVVDSLLGCAQLVRVLEAHRVH